MGPQEALKSKALKLEKGWDKPFKSKDLKILLERKRQGGNDWVHGEVGDLAVLRMHSGVRQWLDGPKSVDRGKGDLGQEPSWGLD